jgi:hypothetical protein
MVSGLSGVSDAERVVCEVEWEVNEGGAERSGWSTGCAIVVCSAWRARV